MQETTDPLTVAFVEKQERERMLKSLKNLEDHKSDINKPYVLNRENSPRYNPKISKKVIQRLWEQGIIS